MNALLELHILQNFAPSNLNRDDTGAPKDAIFGGVRRGRVSSQCLKRAARTYMADQEMLSADQLAIRTKRVVSELAKRLMERGHEQGIAAQVAEVALGGAGLAVNDDGKTQYLLFVSSAEIEALAEAMHDHWDELAALTGTADEDEKSARKRKKAAREKVPKEIKDKLLGAFDKAKAVDLALFGRMLADLPQKNQDAACQVAHALSTHRVDLEYDYYTAVDDLQPDDTSGADMIGTVEFNSACYYRYVALDLNKLGQNLGGDNELALHGLEAFLRASIFAEPSGKQNSFAAHNPPSFIAITVRRNASPRSLTNAFETPMRSSGDKGLVQRSVEALADTWVKLERVYGQPGDSVFVNLTDAKLDDVPARLVHDVEALVTAATGSARSALGA